ncbi:phosphotransferase [Actinosynnema sp. NPDC020468]|uniref:phosphotransferase family protein n=1 Tax=Actinosynnema sp. NPDC020468 TaxID=3154488 RepID=UPI0033D1F548
MREVRALIVVDGRCVGEAPPFTVDVPWWNEVETVTAHLDAALGVTAAVLRLVSTTGRFGRDGTTTYEVEVDRTPAGLSTVDHELTDHPRRLPWAKPGGPADLLAWAGPHERAVQVKTWNLSCVYRLRQAGETRWLKAVPPFQVDEGEVIPMVAEVDPGLVPPLLAAEDRRVLLADVPGHDCWRPDEAVIRDVLPRWVAVQAALAGPPRLRELGFPVPDFGLPPKTVLHGDFHPGNWRSSGVVLDWSDAHWGHPALDIGRLLSFTPEDLWPLIEDVWADAWLTHRPDSDPRAALRHARPQNHRMLAVVYQGFLDAIEPSERVYHEGDVEEELRTAQSFAV